MNDVLIQQFAKLISVKTGLYIREQDRDTLGKKILTRMKWLKMSVPEHYYQLLQAETDQFATIESLQSESEWKELTRLLTTGESYFFRDRGQFKLLENQILPELIRRKKLGRGLEDRGVPSLRIWSAGCSTGEEPYSLAILLQEMIPDWQQWNIFILGTDLNQEAIEKAKRGIYSLWSFRLMEAERQKRYFSQRRDEWEIDEKIRRIVNFRYGNLVVDNFPNLGTEIYNMDLIICRNVFVYFEAKAIAKVIEKFYKTLASGGYLMTAHAELHGQQLDRFRTRIFPESVIYQKAEDGQSDTVSVSALSISPGVLPESKVGDRSSSAPSPERGTGNWRAMSDPLFVREFPSANRQPTAPTPLTPAALSSFHPLPSSISRYPKTADASISSNDSSITAHPQQTVSALVREAEMLLQKESYPEAIQKAAAAIAREPHNFGAHYLMAIAYANLGKYDKASQSCQQAIHIDSLCPDPYYLLAHLAEERGDIESAKSFLKRIIYLAPLSVSAYLELAALYDGEGDKMRARKMRTAAVDLLMQLPANAAVDKHTQLKAGELLVLVQKMLKNSL